MCTDKTLRAHIDSYNELTEKIATLQAAKKAESEFIIREMENRKTDRFHGLRISTRTSERIRKKDVPLKIWDRFKVVSEYKELKPCKV